MGMKKPSIRKNPQLEQVLLLYCVIRKYIEHNIDVIRFSDHVIDLGPEGGDEGGYLVAAGTPKEISCISDSSTGNLLSSHL